MRTVRFKGGPCDGLEAAIDSRDVTPVIRAAVVVTKGYRAVPDLDPDETIVEDVEVPRAVVLTAAISGPDLNAAHDRWVEYYRWPSMSEDGDVAEYRCERPPMFGASFSASG